jgi:YesN/AraC family two-component response regulator
MIRHSRANLRNIVEQFGGEFAGEAENGIAAIAQYERVHPDVVLMDITMPAMDGTAAVEQIVQRNPEAWVPTIKLNSELTGAEPTGPHQPKTP